MTLHVNYMTMVLPNLTSNLSHTMKATASIRRRDGKFMPHICDGYKIKGISNKQLTRIKVILALPLWQQINDWLKVMVCDMCDGLEAGKEDTDNFTYFEIKEAVFKHAIKLI